MSTTTSSCVCNDNNERYERIQITLITLAVISGILALISFLIYLKRRHNNRISPQDHYNSNINVNENNQTLNVLGCLFCCPEDSISVFETNQNYLNFINYINLNIDNMLLSISLSQFNFIEETQSRENTECGICKKNIKRNCLSVKLRCNHSFSKKCIMNWFKIGNNHCPICNQSIIN